jgi:hypothetical protein
MSAAKKKTASDRDERIRKEVFPNSDGQVFDAKTKGFVPLPIEFRLLLRYLTPPQFRVLIYLHLRAGKPGVCYPTIDEIAHDVGVKTAKHVRPLLHALEHRGFIRSGTKGGRTYYLVLDPGVPMVKLLKDGHLTQDAFREINGLREDLGHDPVEAPTP